MVSDNWGGGGGGCGSRGMGEGGLNWFNIHISLALAMLYFTDIQSICSV